jgi:hypothetical protein
MVPQQAGELTGQSPVYIQRDLHLSREKYASLSADDVDFYVIIIKLLDPNFNVIPAFVHRWEIKIYCCI